MLKIGDFSKLSRISVRMLRHYDKCGLLKPETIDSFTGYRYYNESQLLQAGRIQALKNMGFGVRGICGIMERYEDSARLEELLMMKREELEEQFCAIRQRIQLIDGTIHRIRKDGNIMGYDVSLKTIQERYVASVRMIIPGYEEEGRLWKILVEETAHMGMRDGNPCYTLAIFHDEEYKERDVDVEVQKSVTGRYTDTEHVKFKTVPAQQVASAVYKGSYDQIGQVNAAVAEWTRDNGYELSGLTFNIYHVSPNETGNPDEYVTEVCFPVRKK